MKLRKNYQSEFLPVSELHAFKFSTGEYRLLITGAKWRQPRSYVRSPRDHVQNPTVEILSKWVSSRRTFYV